MSMKSLQGHRTPGSRDECRTAPDGRRPLDQAHEKTCATTQKHVKSHVFWDFYRNVKNVKT